MTNEETYKEACDKVILSRSNKNHKSTPVPEWLSDDELLKWLESFKDED